MTETKRMLALTMPLRGRQLIEASAGTGKTWTLAALYVRLVLGHDRGGLAYGLLPPQILVMTFTEAATAELRDRIRQRLQQTAQAFQHGALNHSAVQSADEFLQALLQDTARELWPACAERLTQAVSWMDEAAIHTIHGWSMRALREHAFASGSLFDLQHLEQADSLWNEMIQAYLRRFIYPLSAAELKVLSEEKLDPNPEDWSAALKDPRQEYQRSPQIAPDLDKLPTPAQVLAELAQWLDREQTLLAQVRPLVNAELMAQIKQLKSPKKLGHLRSNLIDPILKRVLDWSLGLSDTVEHKELALLGHDIMVEKGWPPSPAHPALLAIDVWKNWLLKRPESVKTPLLQHALHHVLQAFQSHKASAGLFDFNDLLEWLYWALHNPDSGLAAHLLQQYPAALVDEFQDTDPWQYGALDQIYRPGSDSVLVLIGDPKQAIYSFRGADVQTYIQARQRCLELDPNSLHSLQNNRRSVPELLTVLNELFSVHPQLFGEKIAFHPATPGRAVEKKEDKAAEPGAAVQVVVSDEWADASVQAQQQVLLIFAVQHMIQLLGSEAVKPNDIALLVRSRSQAELVLSTLARYGIAAVFLSDQSQVHTTAEARDLWLVLRALAQPQRSDYLRTALGCALWGIDRDELLGLLADELAWNTLMEQALEWHRRWRAHGILPMLRQWLLDTGAARRLLAGPQGERRLTNVLHLAELLQQATHPMTMQGEANLPSATLRHFERMLQQPEFLHEATQTRLESDEDRVRVVTFHKSKGLQYRHVLIPFLSSGAAASNDAISDDDPDQDGDLYEDTRLLYVAMTRAELSLWLGVYRHGKEFSSDTVSALCRWLGRDDKTVTWSQVWKQLENRISGLAVWVPQSVPKLRPMATVALPLAGGPLPAPQLNLQPWWIASFSTLTRQLEHRWTGVQRPASERDVDTDVGTESAVGTPATDSTSEPWQAFGAGARYGTILHDLLEWQSVNHWPLARTDNDAAWPALIERQGLLNANEREMLSPWLRSVLRTPLPLPEAPALVLSELPVSQHWAEMAFLISASPLATHDLDAWIGADVLPGRARPALAPNMLQGMVVGFIDLVFFHAGRYWVLDYKSNLLPDYSQTSLEEALLAKRYDVQAVLYLLALHRLLSHRLPDYEPSKHLGGGAYLFLRGIDTPGAGLVVQQPSIELIDRLDRCLRPEPNAGAAS